MRIAIPLPLTDFDPSESAIPWSVLSEAGHTPIFATPNAEVAAADERMLSGRGLALWRPILRARHDAREQYRRMVASPEFQAPKRWEELAADNLDALVLPGGHAPGMKPYLESEVLQALCVEMFRADKPVAAICHGVLVLARSIDPKTGQSVLHGRRTTALTRAMEMSAYVMTGLWLGRYYRTYPQTVEDEVVAACADKALFSHGPFAVLRDAPTHLERGFVVRDGNYLSGRWPGDAYRFATELRDMLKQTPSASDQPC